MIKNHNPLENLSPAQYAKILKNQKKVLDRNTRIRMFLMAIKKQEKKDKDKEEKENIDKQP